MQKHEKWNEADARKVLARIEREGKTVAQMARELDVTPQRIYWWRKRLKDEASMGAQSELAFVEVAVASTGRIPAPGFLLHVRGGRALEILPGFDAQELSRLLAVVEALPC